MIYAINYADNKYRKAQKYNTKTAYTKGRADKVIEYGPEDIDYKFFKDNEKIFKYSRGAGLWIWKPYFVLKTLNKMENGDYLFYCDSGAYYVNKIQYLIDCMELNKQEIMTYELPLISKQWTKRETFVYLDCDNDEFTEDNQILATYFLVKKSENTIEFFNQFLKYCCDEKIISYKIFNEKIIDYKEFISHREDQSIFSIICKKNNLMKFRDPSQYGNRPWEYRNKDFIYKEKKYFNSEYPQIVCSYRTEKVLKMKIKEFVKKYFVYLNIYNESVVCKKRNIKK